MEINRQASMYKHPGYRSVPPTRTANPVKNKGTVERTFLIAIITTIADIR